MSEEIITYDTNELATSDYDMPITAELELMSTLSVATPAEKMRFIRAKNDAQSLSKAVRTGEAFDVVDIMQRVGKKKSRDVRLPDLPCVNTYFLLKDGRTLVSQSNGIARSVQDLLSDDMFPDCGRSTEKGFLTLAVVERDLGDGRSYKVVLPVD